MTLELEPLDPIGARIVDADLDDLLGSPRAPGEILAALEENGVLVFRGLSLDDATQLALAKRLGEVIARPGSGDRGASGWSREHPGIYRIALDSEASDDFYVKGSWDWHLDGSTGGACPPKATMLSCRVPPGLGGETEFVSTYAAWDRLSQQEQRRLATIKVWHKIDPALYSTPMNLSDASRERILAEPAQLHPLVWTHRSGRRSLVIGVTASHVEGMSREEGRALLDDLLERATAPACVLSHTRALDDLVIWDNRGTLHRGRPYTEASGRDMHRVTLVGDEPIQ